MVRAVLAFVLFAALMSPAVQAQTADQLNKLSLEALTAPPARGSYGGYVPMPHRSRAPFVRAGRHPAHRSFRHGTIQPPVRHPFVPRHHRR